MSVIRILRLIYGWGVILNGIQIPIWMSLIAAVGLGGVAMGCGVNHLRVGIKDQS